MYIETDHLSRDDKQIKPTEQSDYYFDLHSFLHGQLAVEITSNLVYIVIDYYMVKHINKIVSNFTPGPFSKYKNITITVITTGESKQIEFNSCCELNSLDCISMEGRVPFLKSS